MPCPDTDCSTAAVQRSRRHYFHGDHVPVPVVLAVTKTLLSSPRRNTIGGRILLGSSLGYPVVYITCYPFGGHAGTRKPAKIGFRINKRERYRKPWFFTMVFTSYQAIGPGTQSPSFPSPTWAQFPTVRSLSDGGLRNLILSTETPTRRSCNYPSAACITYIYIYIYT